jgi:hypothetical protein
MSYNIYYINTITYYLFPSNIFRLRPAIVRIFTLLKVLRIFRFIFSTVIEVLEICMSQYVFSCYFASVFCSFYSLLQFNIYIYSQFNTILKWILER